MLRRRDLIGITCLAAMAMMFGSCGPSGPVIIGALLPETGTAEAYGLAIRNGIELAVEEVNTNGELLGGRQLQVEFRDTQTSGSIAQGMAEELLDMDIMAAIGAATSEVTLAITPKFNEKEVVLLSPSASTPELTKKGGPYFFRLYPSSAGEAFRVADFCRDMVMARVAVIAVDDPFGKSIADGFARKYESAAREVVYRRDLPAHETLTAEKATEIVNELKRQRPEAVFIIAYVNEMSLLFQEIERQKLRVAKFAASSVQRELVQKAGEAAERVVFTQPTFDLKAGGEAVQQFAQAYENKFGYAPDGYAARGYDAIKVLVQAYNEAQGYVQDLRGRLLNLERDGASGMIKFDSSGDVAQAPSLYVIYEGQFVPYEQFMEAEGAKSILAR